MASIFGSLSITNEKNRSSSDVQRRLDIALQSTEWSGTRSIWKYKLSMCNRPSASRKVVLNSWWMRKPIINVRSSEEGRPTLFLRCQKGNPLTFFRMPSKASWNRCASTSEHRPRSMLKVSRRDRPPNLNISDVISTTVATNPVTFYEQLANGLDHT